MGDGKIRWMIGEDLQETLTMEEEGNAAGGAGVENVGIKKEDRVVVRNVVDDEKKGVVSISEEAEIHVLLRGLRIFMENKKGGGTGDDPHDASAEG